MDRLTSMQIFVCAVERGGFAPAAAAFDISPTMASKHIRALEERLGARLLHRTTRRQSLTEVGQLYFERCKVILADVERAEAGAEEARATPRGTLRISAPVSFGARRLAPALVDFMNLFPEVKVELELSDRVVDLIDEKFDAAIRIGHLADSTLMARSIGIYRMWLCASPAYLARRGLPRAAADLRRHTCLGFAVNRGRDTWQLLGKRTKWRVQIDVRMSINNGEGLRQAALADGGIIMQPEVLIGADVRDGALLRVLPSFDVPAKPIHVVYLPDRGLPLKLRRFVEFVTARCQVR
jgi:DNA-binding transcriptional LysR family regulator